jgi:hypothetical protein
MLITVLLLVDPNQQQRKAIRFKQQANRVKSA